MAEFTPKLNLEKPAPDDYYNIEVFNSNADKIDEFAGIEPAFQRVLGATYVQGEHFSNGNGSDGLPRLQDFISHRRFNDNTTIVINTTIDDNVNIANVFMGRRTLTFRLNAQLATGTVRFNNVRGNFNIENMSGFKYSGDGGLHCSDCAYIHFYTNVKTSEPQNIMTFYICSADLSRQKVNDLTVGDNSNIYLSDESDITTLNVQNGKVVIDAGVLGVPVNIGEANRYSGSFVIDNRPGNALDTFVRKV